MNLAQQNLLASYKNIIGDAFAHNKGGLSTLAKALELFNQDKSQKAIKTLNKLLNGCQTNQDFAVVYAFLGICYEENFYLDLARDSYERSVGYNNKISTVWSNLGLLYKREGNFSRAIDCFNKAIECDENNAYAHYNLGALYFRKADNENALACCYKALQIQANLYQAAEVVCCIHFIENRMDLHERYYQMAVANGSTMERIEAILEEYKKFKAKRM